MKIERKWAMPNKWTFTIKPIKELLEEEVVSIPKHRIRKQNKKWADPFAGYNSPAKYTNDLDKEAPTAWHLDALNFLSRLKDNSMDGVLYDPPYSITQARQYGKKEYASWNSMGLGKNRGFKMKRLLVVCPWRFCVNRLPALLHLL